MARFPATRTGLAVGLAVGIGSLWLAVAPAVEAHGDVTPQPVDVSRLPPLGAEWRRSNPYRGNPVAIEIGKSAYNQNCARCHGLEAISGGIAPDLRYLEPGDAGDEWYIERFHHGSARDGKVYMPAFGETLGQEAGWAICAWLETVPAE
ncbi:MAG: cytochrome c-550 PedF [Sphingomonadaceae bacterium]|uniref:cytochrome c-550 PedF n=1 Tax=Thermaurantiacus sp. TaxID=2820283 RepID=UPI00298EFDEA|nr:cytochrome c-550 PedF [Thermaurantiacus sp.]MCS6986244.1 cytochrome c-550 PedF [Sphingomonadaceae bacterium]MDW8415691.1 cytochrome c-550 PedF [Thermaurantiacus sp.]